MCFFVVYAGIPYFWRCIVWWVSTHKLVHIQVYRILFLSLVYVIFMESYSNQSVQALQPKTNRSYLLLASLSTPLEWRNMHHELMLLNSTSACFTTSFLYEHGCHIKSCEAHNLTWLHKTHRLCYPDSSFGLKYWCRTLDTMTWV